MAGSTPPPGPTPEGEPESKPIDQGMAAAIAAALSPDPPPTAEATPKPAPPAPTADDERRRASTYVRAHRPSEGAPTANTEAAPPPPTDPRPSSPFGLRERGGDGGANAGASGSERTANPFLSGAVPTPPTPRREERADVSEVFGARQADPRPTTPSAAVVREVFTTARARRRVGDEANWPDPPPVARTTPAPETVEDAPPQDTAPPPPTRPHPPRRTTLFSSKNARTTPEPSPAPPADAPVTAQTAPAAPPPPPPADATTTTPPAPATPPRPATAPPPTHPSTSEPTPSPNPAPTAPVDAPPPTPEPATSAGADDPRPTPRWEEPPPVVVEEPQEATELLNQHGRLFASAPPREAGRRRARTLPLRAALRTLLRQRRRLMLSVVAITLGIGYLAGSLSLLHRVDTGLAQQAGAGTEVADLVVEGEVAVSSLFEEVRRLVPHSLTTAIADVPGVAAVEPRLESGALLISDGEVVVGLGLTERPIGVNWPTEESLNPYTLETGRGPTGPDEVVIDATSADTAGVSVGDPIVVAGTDAVDQFTIVGIMEPLPSNTEDGESLAAFETETARGILSIAADDNFIAIDVADDASIEEVRDDIAALLPPGTEVVDRATFLDHRQASLSKSFSLVRYLLLGFTALAIVVGAFTVANSMALLYDHRRRGFALLRLLGGSPRTLMGAASAEAVLAGLIAALIGVAAGLAIGQLIELAVRSLGAPIRLGGGRLTWWIPVVAAVVGVTVTVATSLRPARQAADTPPLRAVVHTDRDPRPRRAGRWVWRGLVVAVAAGLGWYAADAIIDGPSPMLAAAALGIGAAVVLAIPPALGTMVTAATGLFFRRTPPLRKVATADSAGARSRTSATTAALVLAAAVVTGLASLSTSFIASVDDQIESAVLADLVVDSGTVGPSGLTDEVVPRLREIDGVEAVSGWRVGSVLLDGQSSRAAGLDGGSALDLFDFGLTDETLTSFGSEEVLVHRSLADDLGRSIGDQANLRFQSGTSLTVTIAGIFDSGLSTLLGNVIVDSDLMASQETNGRDVMAFVRLEDPEDVTSAAEVERLGLSAGADSVVPADELFDGRAELLQGFSRVILWMVLFSVALALVGVVNTLQLGINERRRELGLLRSVGATPRQIVRLTLVEAVAMALVGTVVGVGLGLLITRGAVAALSGVGLSVFSVPTLTIAAVAIATIGLALVSAVLPSYRAAHTPLLAAIAEDESPTTPDRGRRRGRRGRRGASTAIHSPSRSTPPPPTAPPTTADATPEPTPTAAPDSHLPPPRSTTTTESVSPPPPPHETPTTDPASGAIDEVPAARPSSMTVGEDAPSEDFPTEAHEPAPASGNSMGTGTTAESGFAGRGSTEPPQTEPVSADRNADVIDDDSTTESESEEPDVTTPSTCYNCGNDPMDAETCVHCGAVQLPAPVGMFSTSPEAAADRSGGDAPRSATPPSSSGGMDDIVDATIIPDDAAEFEQHYQPNGDVGAPPPPPPPPSEPAAARGPGNGEHRTIGSIFDDPIESAARSPFGQFANNPDADLQTAGPDPGPTPSGNWDTGPTPQGPPTAPPGPSPRSSGWDSTPGNGSFGGDPYHQGYREPTRPHPGETSRPHDPGSWSGAGAAGPYAQGAPTGASSPYAQPPTSGPQNQVVGDGHGFAAAIAYLNSPSANAAQTAFAIAGALLSPEEPVRGVVAGKLGNAPAAVVETAHRVIIVADQRYVPIVHTLHVGPGLEVHGRHVGSQASLTFTSGAQTIQIDGIDDVNIAVGLAGSVRSATVGTDF